MSVSSTPTAYSAGRQLCPVDACGIAGVQVLRGRQAVGLAVLRRRPRAGGAGVGRWGVLQAPQGPGHPPGPPAAGCGGPPMKRSKEGHGGALAVRPTSPHDRHPGECQSTPQGIIVVAGHGPAASGHRPGVGCREIGAAKRLAHNLRFTGASRHDVVGTQQHVGTSPGCPAAGTFQIGQITQRATTLHLRVETLRWRAKHPWPTKVRHKRVAGR